MPGFARSRETALIAALLLVAGCARRAPEPIAAAPRAPPPRPVLPMQFTAVVPPAAAPDGGYATINHGIDPLQTMWHVRAALNVAAIGCRGPEGAGLVASYNGLLKSEKIALAKANTSVQASFHGRYGAGWQAAHDRYMTQLYNFFAQPFAKASFCEAAATVAAEAAAASPAAFPEWSIAALPRLEAPFLDGYRQIDSYRLASADWDARYGPNADRTMLAETTPAMPVAPIDPAPRAFSTRPQLAYSDIGMVMAWQQPDVTIASR